MKALAVIAVASSAVPAYADRHVELGRCTAFDTGTLQRAIDREISTDIALDGRNFAVIVECPDLVTARMHVEPVPADGPIARALDLGEVPGGLRIRLLAMAVAELVQVASAAAPPAPAPPPSTTKRSSRDPVDPQHLADGPQHVADRPQHVADKPQHLADKPPGVATRPATAPAAKRVATVTSDARVVASAPSPSPRPGITITPHLGIRAYSSTPLAEVGGELGLPQLRIGVHGSIGQLSDTRGTLRPWLATVSLARELVCVGDATSLCGLVRIEGGVVGVMAHASSTASAHDAVAAYGQGGIGIELVHRFGTFAGIASVDTGWSEGLIARSGTEQVAELAGMFVIGAIGARWR